MDVNQDQDSMIIRSLDVRWPMPQLTITPEHLQTYPEQPAMAILEFPEVKCPPVVDNYATAIPEFWLELHYCGQSLISCHSESTDGSIRNNSQVRVLGMYGMTFYFVSSQEETFCGELITCHMFCGIGRNGLSFDFRLLTQIHFHSTNHLVSSFYISCLTY